MLALLRPETPAKSPQRTLIFKERVTYQRAIEEVYWRHRIWPKENARPKPPLDEVMSQAQIEKKVEDYLRKSQFVAHQGGSPISATELQAEMDRMGSHTLHPRVLLELFQALANDPFVIAECLARPLVAERLASELKGEGYVEALLPNAKKLTGTIALISQRYKLPQISVPLDCTDDTWTATTTVNAPDERAEHTALWTGSEMIVWGGYNFNNNQLNTLNTGGRYDPATDGWMPTSTTNAPIGRALHAAVWTGSEMIVWGGYNYPALDLNGGGRYNPATDTWIATSTASAAVPREQHSAVWSGTEMIVWGGRDTSTWFNSGGRYNPNTDSWTSTNTINAPEARWYHSGVWTGSEMVIWGGTNQTIYLDTGGKYNPTDNSWTVTTTANAPLGRVGHSTIWSGSETIVWAGTDSTFNDTNTGGRYNPGADSWMATNPAKLLHARDSHTAVWTGTEMIVWGGAFCYPCMDFNDGARYNPANDGWAPISTANAPLARFYHTAVWDGTEMIVWGGYNYETQTFFDTGGRYCAQRAATPTPTLTPALTATPTPRMTPVPRARPTPPPRPTP